MIEIKAINKPQIAKIIDQHFFKLLIPQKVEELLKENKIAVKQNVSLEVHNNNLITGLATLIYVELEKDAQFISQKDASFTSVSQVFKSKTKSLIATMLYRIANFFYYTKSISQSHEKTKIACRELMEECIVLTSIDIHPAAQIGEKFFIDHGHNVVIGETTIIGKECNLFNGVILGSKNVVSAKPGKRHPTLLDGVTVCAGAKILGNITIGNNVFISPSAVVLDDIPDEHKVLIINQLQISKQEKYSYLPSQKLVIYGIIPKFKNSIAILGEGFYNPTVLIKLKNEKTVNYTITFWDKNKILIKFKHTSPFEKEVVKDAKVIVLSNSNKVVVVNNIALEKALTTITP